MWGRDCVHRGRVSTSSERGDSQAHCTFKSVICLCLERPLHTLLVSSIEGEQNRKAPEAGALRLLSCCSPLPPAPPVQLFLS